MTVYTAEYRPTYWCLLVAHCRYTVTK